MAFTGSGNNEVKVAALRLYHTSRGWVGFIGRFSEREEIRMCSSRVLKEIDTHQRNEVRWGFLGRS